MSFNVPTSVIAAPAVSSIGAGLFADEAEKENVLIVDDSPTVRKMFGKYLSERYNCVEAESAIEAFALLAKTDFALVLTDILMPGISGIELLRKIIETYPYTAVIMISGVNNSQRALDAMRIGAFDYLIKPCDLNVLQITVERALERRALILNARQYKIDLERRNSELARGKADLERLQAQIIHNEKMASLGQLTAGIAHELNNPVGFIYGNLDILNEAISSLTKLLEYYEGAPLPESVALGAEKVKEKIDYHASLEDLELIIRDCREGAQRIRDIVQNLRTFSRLDEAEFAKTDIHEGIDSTIRLLSRYYSADNITLIRDYGQLPSVDAYSGQLNQVWMNLLANAAQAVSNGGGEVRVRTGVEGEYVYVSVSDTGCGISREHLNRIFDPFFTTKSVGEGTGLGLSISFSIVERHRGTITVESELNKGTTFTVKIPIHNKPQPARDAE